MMARKNTPSILRTLRLVALFALILAIGKLGLSARFYTAAAPTIGVVLETVWADNFLGPKTSPVIGFIDIDNEKRVAIPENVLATRGFVPGQKVHILYDIRDPESIRLDTPVGIWGTGVLWLVFALVPVLILSGLIAATRKRAPKLRPSPAQRQNRSIRPMHITPHQGGPEPDTPVVRRMR